MMESQLNLYERILALGNDMDTSQYHHTDRKKHEKTTYSPTPSKKFPKN